MNAVYLSSANRVSVTPSSRSWRPAALAGLSAALLIGASVFGFCAFAAPLDQAVPANSFSASGGRGSLMGVVRDGNEDPIPGARVIVLGDGGEVLFETKSSNSSSGRLDLGAFEIDRIPAGRYLIVAKVDGSRARSRPMRVPVTAWLDTRVRLHVDLGT